MKLTVIARELSEAVGRMRFGTPVTHVYNPLDYAWTPHRQYLQRYGTGRRDIVLIGMNPGPWGMAQTGVPFGDVPMVRDWLGIEAEVGHPRREHPKRPIQGFACARREVSGQRLWGWAHRRFGTPARFFERFFVHNYCPLCFLEAGGRNRTPDRLSAREQARLFRACDRALADVLDQLKPRYVIGIGRFAHSRAEAVVGTRRVTVGMMTHPSPANPAANRGWGRAADRTLRELGIRL